MSQLRDYGIADGNPFQLIGAGTSAFGQDAAKLSPEQSAFSGSNRVEEAEQILLSDLCSSATELGRLAAILSRSAVLPMAAAHVGCMRFEFADERTDHLGAL